MTDRINGIYVALDKEYRTDDVEPILQAIRMIRGVLTVSTEDFVVDLADWVAEQRVRAELHEKLFSVLYPKKEV